MNLIFPAKNLNEFATEDLIRDSINSLVSMDNDFLILEKTELTYVQILNTENGFVVQFQDDRVSSHYEFSNYMSRPKATKMFLKYLNEDIDWKLNESYERLNVIGFWGRLGYKLGYLYGKLIKKGK